MTVSDNAPVGLKAAVRAAGLTQAQLAEQLGVTDTSVNRWLNGTLPIPTKRLVQLEDLTGWVPEGGTLEGWTEFENDPQEWLAQYGAGHGGGKAGGATPLGMLVRTTRPNNQPAIPSEPEEQVSIWARFLHITQGQLVAMVMKDVPITWAVAQGVAEAGYKYVALAEHFFDVPPTEAALVEAFLEELEAKAPPTLYDVQQLLNDFEEGEQMADRHVEDDRANLAVLYNGPGLWNFDSNWEMIN